MRAVVVTPGKQGTAEVVRRDAPRLRSGECLVRVLEVGIDGTDREIDEGLYGAAPPGDDTLVLGHEALALIDVPAEPLHEGDLVVPTVRRPCPERCANCRNGEMDFCRTGHFTERGIKGRHGFLREHFAEHPDFLIPIPPHLRTVAVLLEPLSILEKAFRQLDTIQERMRWEPRMALITGSGSIALFAAFVSRLRGYDVILYSRGASGPAETRIIEQLELSYADATAHSLDEVTARYGTPDLAIEATGFSPLAWEVADVLALNGAACLLSVTAGQRRVEIPSDRLNSDLVLGNRVIFGSVNAQRRDFERGLQHMGEIISRWPGALESMITRRFGLDRVREALGKNPPDDIKTVIEVAG